MDPAKAQAMNEIHGEWVRAQVAAGVDGPVPPGRPEGSDYNQHYADMEAPPAAQDALHNQLRSVVGLPPLREMLR